MIRWMGVILVLWGGIFGLTLQLRERRRKMETLRTMIDALRYLAEEIRMTRTPLPRLLERVGDRISTDTGRFFDRIAESLRNGEPPEAVWRQELEDLPLTEEDRSVLQDVDLQGDTEKICNGLSLVIERLTRRIEDQRQKTPQETKRYAALWFSTAAMLVILLI